MRRPWLEPLAVAVLFLLIAGLTVYGFVARPWLSTAASEHGHGVDRMIRYLLVTTGILFIVGHGALIGLVWKNRGGGPSTYKPVSRRAEWISALLPVLFMSLIAEGGVLAIGLPVWAKVYGDAPADAVEVEVVGKQFEWFIRYPGKDGKFGRVKAALVHETDNPFGLDPEDPTSVDDLVSRGVLRVPTGRMTVVRLRSHDVLHSFSIPELRVKQDVVPGMTLKTQFVPERAGRFEIACAELCGLGHYRMRGFLEVKSPEDFQRWLGQQVGWFEE